MIAEFPRADARSNIEFPMVRSVPLLPALVALAWLTGGCQADIDGNMPATGGSSAQPPGTGGGQALPPEPSDWLGAVQQADCTVPAQLTRTRIRRLSEVQWKNTVAQGLGVAAPTQELPQDAISSAT